MVYSPIRKANHMRKILNPPKGTKELHFHECCDGMVVAYSCSDSQHQTIIGFEKSLPKDVDMVSAILLYAEAGIQAQTLPTRML